MCHGPELFPNQRSRVWQGSKSGGLCHRGSCLSVRESTGSSPCLTASQHPTELINLGFVPCLTFNALLLPWLNTAGVMARTPPATGGRKPRFHPHPGTDLLCNNDVKPYSRNLPTTCNHCSTPPLVAFPTISYFVHLYLDTFSCIKFKKNWKNKPPKQTKIYPFFLLLATCLSLCHLS